jgi:hypothetical protein
VLSSGRSGNDSEVGSKWRAGPESQTDNANRRKRQGSNRGPAQARHTILPQKCDHSHRQTMISDFPGKYLERGHTDLPTLSQLAAKRPAKSGAPVIALAVRTMFRAVRGQRKAAKEARDPKGNDSDAERQPHPLQHFGHPHPGMFSICRSRRDGGRFILRTAPARNSHLSRELPDPPNAFLCRVFMPHPGAFSSEVDTGSREENASKQKTRASVLIPSEPMLKHAAGRGASPELPP